MKVQQAIFIYNNDLLNKICTEETDYLFLSTNFVGLKTLTKGSLIKCIGEHQSCIVVVNYIGSQDINHNCKVFIKLVKTLPGELDIEY